MTELEQLIFDLLKNGVSLNKIQDTLNISNQVFLTSIKNIRAYYPSLSRELDSSGTYFLKPTNNIEQTNRIRIKMYKDNIRLLHISDLHIGNKNDRLDLLDTVFDHAKSKGIHYITNTGDIIENIHYLKQNKLRLKTIKGQIYSFIKNYPYDKDIHTITILGNHDVTQDEEGINIQEIINSERHDIITLGYGLGLIDLKNDTVALEHNLIGDNKHHQSSNHVTFRGHSHKTKYDLRRDNALIFVPALSDALPTNYKEKPLKGFLESEIKLNEEGYIKRIFIKEYTIEPHKRLASEMTLSLRRDDNND